MYKTTESSKSWSLRNSYQDDQDDQEEKNTLLLTPSHKIEPSRNDWLDPGSVSSLDGWAGAGVNSESQNTGEATQNSFFNRATADRHTHFVGTDCEPTKS
jgi:hypothetical protein